VNTPPADTPIVCTAPTDAGPEGIAEYRRLFAAALTGREKTTEGIRFRFRAADGIEAWVRDLAAREKACCAFFTFTITHAGDEVLWDPSATTPSPAASWTSSTPSPTPSPKAPTNSGTDSPNAA